MKRNGTIQKIAKKATDAAFVVVLIVTALQLEASQIVLLPAGANWRYLDNGSDQGTAWRVPAFNDSSWTNGNAQFGYGDGDEATVVKYGTNGNNKYITTYFRNSFNVPNPAAYTSDLTLSLIRDDGAVIYLNGREVLRNNMPAGAINYRTLAATNVVGTDESTFFTFSIAATNLVSGANVLAVEIHQAATNSTDISFDLQLAVNPPPITITQIAPTQDATGVNAPANLQVALSNVTANVGVTIYGRPAGPAPGPDFTIVAMPDTQFYVSSMNGGTPSIFTQQTDWIVSQKTARNIAFVTHLGDCVQNGDNGGNPIEWQNATNAMYRLENPQTTFAAEGIPYGIAVGNHDQTPIGDPTGQTKFYNQFFGESHFNGHSYYGGHYGTNNNNHYQLFSASGLDFVIVHIEYDPAQDTNVLGWANNVLQTYADRRAIVVSHSILAVTGSFSPQGQKIYDGLKTNANLFLMLCGHDPGEAHRTDTFNGHTVHTILSDFQGRTNGGSGFLRLVEFSPSNNVIRIKTYSPTFAAYENDGDSDFILPCDLRPSTPMMPLASFTGVCCTTNLNAAWSGLNASTPYEWCVAVNDGVSIQTSPIFDFTTAAHHALAPTPSGPGGISFNRATQTLGVSFPATLGSVYQLVYRDNIASGQWLPTGQEVTANTATLNWNLPLDPANPARFFALQWVR